MTTRPAPASPRSIAVLLVVVCGCWSAAVPPRACAQFRLPEDRAAAGEVVGEEEDVDEVDEVDGQPAGEADRAPARDPLAPVLAILADNLVLGWKGGRLELDVHALESAFYGPEFAREREAVQATVERMQKLVIDEAVANGLARDKAEKIFGSIRDRIVDNHRHLFFGGDDRKDGLGRYFEKVTPGTLLQKACERTWEQAQKRRLLGNGGGGGGSGGGEENWEWHQSSHPFEIRGKITAAAGECTLSHDARDLKFAFTGECGLSVRWDTEADDEGRGQESVRLVQTANQFRARHVRDGEIVLTLEGESFRECCRIKPEVVRRELVPLLRRIGVGPPAMPEDRVVKDEVLTRLRRAAGVAEPARDGKGETLAAAKHRLAQTGAVIDAFSLLDEAAYLTDLKQGAAAADVPAIEARLAKLPATAKE